MGSPVVLVVMLVVSAALRDLNVIATEPGRADETTNLLIEPPERLSNSTTERRGLLCHGDELLDKYCALTSFGAPVCASDGRLYASACELARANCQPDAPNLCRLGDESWCRAQQSARCSREAYRLFKLALWREFNSSASLLFDRLDQNADGQLEARELWPKLSAREYNDDLVDLDTNLNTCAFDATATTNTNNQLGVEFAFERHFHWSPCSLSHLLVHEETSLRAHSSSAQTRQRRQPATRAEFVRLFDEFERPHGAQIDHLASQRTIASELIMQIGESKLIECLPQSDEFRRVRLRTSRTHCAWTRHGVNLASIRNSEPHVSIVTSGDEPPGLRLIDAQLYLSGVYRCSCYGTAQEIHTIQKSQMHTVHLVRVQVLAQLHVSVRPKFQWSLPGSRVAFECHHDYIDTSDDEQFDQLDTDQIEWLLNKQSISSLLGNSSQPERGRHHRLVLERVRPEDSGQYTCQVNARLAVKGAGSGRLLIQDHPSLQDQTGEPNQAGASLLWSFHANGVSVFRLQLPELDGQELELVRELSGQSRVSEQVDGNWNQLTLCGGLTPEQVVICEWSDNAILVEVPPTAQAAATEQQQQHTPRTRKYIYIGQPNLNRVLVFDGRAGELVAVVATEPQPRRLFAFKPNKIHLSKWVRRRLGPLASLRWLQALEYHKQQQQQQQRAGRYLPQSQAYPLGMTPKSSRLYSNRASTAAAAAANSSSSNDDDDDNRADGEASAEVRAENNVRRRFKRHLADQREWTGGQTNSSSNSNSNSNDREQQRSLPPMARLVQYDIWLLCYGKPLLVDAQSDLSDLPQAAPMAKAEEALEFAGEEEEEEEEQEAENLLMDDQQEAVDHQRPGRINRVRATQKIRRRMKDDRAQMRAVHSQNDDDEEPTFTPWPHWGSLSPLLARGQASTRSKEARLRNRKSVQVIQSTFLPGVGRARARSPTHHHHYNPQMRINETASLALQTLNEFKRLTVLTTHHVIANPRALGAPSQTAYSEVGAGNPFASPPPPAGIDLVQDLCVPERPHSQVANQKFKLHHAYVTHYAERQLYRVAMDTYRYDREIDLRQCDPLALVPAVQGLLIVQCRAPITHQLNGQLVLDELTSARVQFNAQIKAQQAHLTPDSRYLVSILANESINASSDELDNQRAKHNQQSSVIYVQSVRVAGLKFMYEIKTSLEVAQCSFVWRDGYYAAIFVALNRRDRQTELLSLRLADGRLELIVRVPGLAWSPTARHREPLNVNQELQVASLSTGEGLYLVDLEENRVIQGVHDHNHRTRQSSLPTLLWV